jgi:dihydrodipicolinate synthase/N-acetylneuraminate lyase
VPAAGDDNVHEQSFEMLVNELIANGKAFYSLGHNGKAIRFAMAHPDMIRE